MTVIAKQKILLPKNVDYEKWAVIACDQFTSQPEYWKDLADFVGDSPSTLNLIFPEVYLEEGIEKRVENINKCMQEYLDNGIFSEIDGFVLTERKVEGGKTRLGLILSVDLETFDYRRVRVPIRSTEDTILERLPVRMKIRGNAPIELPHILLLVDDPEKKIIEPLYARKEELKKLYDFDLNMDGGHIAGYEVTDTDSVMEKFDSLLDSSLQIKKYGVDAGIMLAVGDGNHSMATAKEHWNLVKKGLSEADIPTHPARFALVEVLNVYDEGLIFEPIHRVITEGGEKFLSVMREKLSGNGKITVITKEGDIELSCPDKSGETIKAVQSLIEEELKKGTIKVDYIHGEEHLRGIVEETAGLGILMPSFAKEELISYVINVGNLPKKAFSIGTAENKKYYIEGKRITNGTESL